MNNVPPVDWSSATKVGLGLVPAGPKLSRDEIAELVADLRVCAERAEAIVSGTTQLTAPPAAEPYVVDRPTWLRWNADLAGGLLGPYTSTSPTLVERAVGGAAALQVGTTLAWLGTKVLGQFDPFAATPRLLLVAPNVADAERKLGVDHHAFRLWVCVHEVTHRYQFAHAPWLADHLRGLLARVVAGEAQTPAGWRPSLGAAALLEAALGADGKAALGEITAVMSLLEGYADFMMDRTGKIPGVDAIRARFQVRREAPGFDAVLRTLTGLDVKVAQYRNGASFCRQVVEAVGVDGLNRAYLGVETLPTPEEISEPARWVDRVC